MKNEDFYEILKERIGRENKETIWENAKFIYDQCRNKKYLENFTNQQEFAEYLGITKGHISRYRYAYEYFLLYENKFDVRKFSVEQAYYLYRKIGTCLVEFDNWVKEEKNTSVENIGVSDTKKYVFEYLNQKNGMINETIAVNESSVEGLTDHEKEIIQFYRNGTDEQRDLIDAMIRVCKNSSSGV